MNATEAQKKVVRSCIENGIHDAVGISDHTGFSRNATAFICCSLIEQGEVDFQIDDVLEIGKYVLVTKLPPGLHK